MPGTVASVGKHQQTELWIAPVVGALLAGGLAALGLLLDQWMDWREAPLPIFSGHPDTARTFLSVIAASVTTLIALIFTILTVAIQLASSQYSPRALSTLLQDRPSHFTIGIFVGTFTYTLVVLLALRVVTFEDGDVVSGITMTFAFVLAVVSLATFAVYSNHIIHSVRVTSIINRVGETTRKAVERLYPDPHASEERPGPRSPEGSPSRIIHARRPGVVTDLDDEALFRLACERDCSIEIGPMVGAFVPEGSELVRVYGECEDDIEDMIELSKERSIDRDIAFGLRQLSDIALRALSPGINDPATAVQALDQLHDLLRQIIQRDLGHGVRTDEAGRVRLVLRTPDWENILRIAVEEIRIDGADSLQVVRRLRATLEDLFEIAPDDRRRSVERQLELLDAAIEKAFDSAEVRDVARESDLRGIGF